jgi:hypothetical protein
MGHQIKRRRETVEAGDVPMSRGDMLIGERDARHLQRNQSETVSIELM